MRSAAGFLSAQGNSTLVSQLSAVGADLVKQSNGAAYYSSDLARFQSSWQAYNRYNGWILPVIFLLPMLLLTLGALALALRLRRFARCAGVGIFAFFLLFSAIMGFMFTQTFVTYDVCSQVVRPRHPSVAG